MVTLPVSTQMIPVLAFLTFLPFFLYEVLAVKYIFFLISKNCLPFSSRPCFLPTHRKAGSFAVDFSGRDINGGDLDWISHNSLLILPFTRNKQT